MIYHIASESAWQAAERQGSYRADSLDSEGFIHCSTRDQLVEVANRLYRDRRDLVLLCIDDGRVDAEIRYENLEGGRQPYPHVYGEIDLDAICDALLYEPGPDGTFGLPALA